MKFSNKTFPLLHQPQHGVFRNTCKHFLAISVEWKQRKAVRVPDFILQQMWRRVSLYELSAATETQRHNENI